MPTPVDDSELVERALSGDREAFGMLLDRHYGRMYRMAYRIVGSAAEAEDIAQDVCLRLVDRLAHFRSRSRFSTWLASVVINACRDALRRRRSTENLVSAYGMMRDLEASDSLDQEARAGWLERALSSLDPSLRETVVLVVAEDMSHAEAARALGCAEGTVAWRMHQVKKRLKARLDEADG
jgi:RNA polymerase sigma-70 factor (ECF subfamily)